MPYPKQPDHLKKRGVGVSLDDLTIRRIDALHKGIGRRSDLLRRAVLIGLASIFGKDWEKKADALIADESERAA